jgi:hypothetical protein
MSDGVLDLGPLERAVARLGEGLVRYEKDISDAQIRDGLIQRFAFTYEISHKMLKRFLEMTSPSPAEFDAMTYCRAAIGMGTGARHPASARSRL